VGWHLALVSAVARAGVGRDVGFGFAVMFKLVTFWLALLLQGSHTLFLASSDGQVHEHEHERMPHGHV
jgi:hypothetical protein